MLDKIKELVKKLEIPALYELDGKPHETVQVKLKFIDSFGSWEWYAWEAEISDNDIMFFGYVKGFETEIGYFSLSQLMSVNQSTGIDRIIVDESFSIITLEELKKQLTEPYRPYPTKESLM